MKETVCLSGPERNLVGILSEPDTVPAGELRSAVLLLNSGLLHRAAPHRMYVQLARRLAGEGLSACRFDLAGYGDSLEPAGRKKPSPEQNAIDDTLAVMDTLERERGIRQFALLGICSGAYLSVRMATLDPRVVAAVPVNPPVELFTSDRQFISRLEKRRAAEDLGSRALLDSDRWRRLLSGQIRPGRVIEILARKLNPDAKGGGAVEAEVAAVRQTSLEELRRLGENVGQACLIFSCGELGYDFLSTALDRELLNRAAPNVELRLLENVDHLFIQYRSSARFIDETCEWFNRHLRSRG